MTEVEMRNIDAQARLKLVRATEFFENGEIELACQMRSEAIEMIESIANQMRLQQAEIHIAISKLLEQHALLAAGGLPTPKADSMSCTANEMDLR